MRAERRRISARAIRQIPLLAVGALSVLAGSVAFGQGSSEMTPAEQRARVAAVAPELPRLIRAYDRDQRAEDRLAGDPVAALAALGDARPDEDPRLTRRLRVGDGAAAFVWPWRNGVCFSVAGGGGCMPTAFLRERGVALSTSFSADSAEVAVFALVRPGIPSVTLELADGEQIEARVSDNALYVVVTSDPVRATWRNPDGSHGTQEGLLPPRS